MSVLKSDVVALDRANTPELVSAARTLFREYADALGIDLEYQGFAAELASLPAPYTPPDGALFIARVREEWAGCAALRPLGNNIGELKRLFVRPAHRQLGLGQHLLGAVIAAAGQAGYRELRLDTLPSMASAQALYRRLGFVEIPPYHDKYLPGTRFFALALRSRDA